MSGHSKWATIKHAKGLNDAKRGKIFSRLSKLISIAVREGGGIDNPEDNPRLRVIVEKARNANMPKENIKRAIDKGAGRIAGSNYEEISYEGFGPYKIAMIVECMTDNKNRTNSDIKALFDKHGGVLASSGSTSYFFGKKGYIDVTIPEGKNREEIELEIIDFGVEDFVEIGENELRLYVESTKTHEISEKIKNIRINVMDSDITMIPSSYIEINEKEMERFNNFLEIIDENDDVSQIYHNAKKA